MFSISFYPENPCITLCPRSLVTYRTWGSKGWGGGGGGGGLRLNPYPNKPWSFNIVGKGEIALWKRGLYGSAKSVYTGEPMPFTQADLSQDVVLLVSFLHINVPFYWMVHLVVRSNDWLIVWCLMPFSTVFQIYRGNHCTYPCFPGAFRTSAPYNISTKPLAAFPHNNCWNNGQWWERNESCHSEYHQSSEGILAYMGIKYTTSWSQVLYATDWSTGLSWDKIIRVNVIHHLVVRHNRFLWIYLQIHVKLRTWFMDHRETFNSPFGCDWLIGV